MRRGSGNDTLEGGAGDDTRLNYVSNQSGNGGAHDGNDVGTIVFLNCEIADVTVDAGVYYGVEEPFSATG